MDKERRERISEAVGLIHQAREILEEVLDEEQKCYESLPEGMQNGEKGEQMQENMEIIGMCWAAWKTWTIWKIFLSGYVRAAAAKPERMKRDT